MAITLVAFLLIGLLRYITFHINAFNPIAQALSEFSTTDLFYRSMVESADTCDAIVIVDVTQLHDRASIARALEEVDSLGPSAIDVDIIFERPMDRTGDSILQEVATRVSENAVFSFRMMDPDPQTRQFTRQSHSFFAEKLNLREGFVNVDRRMTRDIPLNHEMDGKTYRSAIAQMMDVLGMEYDQQEERHIDYSPTIFRVIPYDAIQENAEHINGHIVMFGGAYESVDMLYTPLGAKHGIEVLSYAMNTMRGLGSQTECKGTIYWLLTILFSFIGVCIIVAYKDWVINMGDNFVGDVLRTIFITSIVIFLLMAIYMSIAFYLFVTRHINFDLTPTLSVMALTTTARDIVCIANKYLHLHL